MSYNKLVRDNIPEIMIKNNQMPITRILDDKDYKKELEKKLQEEMNEVLDSAADDRIEELADLYEVITYLAKCEGKNINDVIKKADEKRISRGGFEKKIFLEGVKND